MRRTVCPDPVSLLLLSAGAVRLTRGRDPGWHLGLDVPAVARELLPRRPSATARAAVREPTLQRGGGQRHLLLAAASGELPGVVRADAGGLRLRAQGQPLPDAHAQAARPGSGAGQLLRLGCAGAAGEARAHPLAVPAVHALRRGAVPGVSGAPAAGHARAGPARTRARAVHGGSRVAGAGRTPAGAPRGRVPPRELPDRAVHGSAARARRGAGGGGRGRAVPDRAGRDRRLGVRAPARLAPAVRQRLHAAGGRGVGRAGAGVA